MKNDTTHKDLIEDHSKSWSKRMNYTKPISYDALSEKSGQGRIYRFLKLSFPSVSKERRREVMNGILNEKGTIGVIEWWAEGSVIHKSQRESEVILIKEV